MEVVVKGIRYRKIENQIKKYEIRLAVPAAGLFTSISFRGFPFQSLTDSVSALCLSTDFL